MARLCLQMFGLLLGALFWCCPSATGHAAEPVSAGGDRQETLAAAAADAPVTLEADRLSYQQEGEVYSASGQVLLEQGAFSLQAEELLLEGKIRDLSASGAIFVRQPEGRLQGEAIHYNLTTGEGRIRQGRAVLGTQNFHLSGASLTRTGPDSYQVRQGRFTTCSGEIPDWEFTAAQVDVSMGRYARVRHAWFRVRDLPVFYFPYLVYPVKTERETGLLMPRFGYSRERGLKTSLAWYQVLDRNQDATLYLDYLTEKGVGKGLEYRYLFAGENLGLARYYHVSGIGATPDLYAVEWRHGGLLPGQVRLTADVEYVDDRLLFEDFGEAAEDYNQDQTLATVIAQRNWHKLNLAGHLRYLKDLEGDNDLTRQRLPEVSAALVRYRLWQTPFYAGFESLATRFRSDRGPEGERYLLRPSLAAAFKPGSWLTLDPEIALNHRFYGSDAGTDDESTVPEYSLALRTYLQRVFAFERWGFDRLRHRVEPEIRYLYIPEVDQAGLPFFAGADRILPRNRIEYALINRLTARSQAHDGSFAYREILKLRLSQSFVFDEEGPAGNDREDSFSALRIELDLRPSEYGELSVDGELAVDAGRTFNRLEVEARLKDRRGNRLEAGYFLLREEALAPDLEADYLKAAVETSLLEPVYLNLEQRYDVAADRSLETVIGMEYRARCWSVMLAFRDRLDDQAVTVNFMLAGLGGSEGFW